MQRPRPRLSPAGSSARIAIVFTLALLCLVLTHLSLLRLPYFWDEGGYYIPAALDFYHSGALIPHYTNAHPPLPNILLGLCWHIFGFHILVTRLAVAVCAATALTAVFRFTRTLLGLSAAATVTALTLVYPIWFTQSTLAHADIFAAALVLGGLAVYAPRLCVDSRFKPTNLRSLLAVSALFSLAALAKETAIVQPLTLCGLEIVWRLRRRPQDPPADQLRWAAALAFPALPLLGWYLYHWLHAGFMFGNPEYLRYNATANFTWEHLSLALRYRFLHLFWQRDIWLPIVLALACLLLPEQREAGAARLPRRAAQTIFVLVAVNWIAFSVLGGALLTRYLLPMYPLILVVCVAVWQSRTRRWPLLAAITAAAFVSALWLNPPTSFAPEDNLTYRDMIVVDQEAIHFVAEHYPQAQVLTAWPVSADLFRPELGYVTRPIRAVSIEDFTAPQVRKAAEEQDLYDTAIVFTTHFVTPAFRRYLLAHPDSRRGREFAQSRDLTPEEIAQMLGGRIVWQDDIQGEWAAVLRFDRSYEAQQRAVPGNEDGVIRRPRRNPRLRPSAG